MDIQETAQRYIADGLTSYGDIVDHCVECARSDAYIRKRMVWKSGSVGAFAYEVYEEIKRRKRK